MRILGGKARGVALKVPASARPSPVRLRKALFDYLRLRYPRRGRFLDLFAGSGAVGLEAASEGWEAVLVEKDPEAVRLLKENVRRTGLGARVVALPREGGRVDPERALAFLLEEGVDGVLLEGGPRLAGAFLERGLVDKLALFLAPRILGEGRGLAEGFRVERVAEALRLRLARREWLGENLWLEAYPEG